jgi:hypothetical protein
MSALLPKADVKGSPSAVFDPDHFVRRIIHDGERRLIASSCSRCRAVLFCSVIDLVATEDAHVKWCALSLSPLVLPSICAPQIQ